MRKLINAAIFIMIAVASTAALAESMTVTLSVSGMTWGSCVTSVQRSLTKINGVTKTDVSLEKAEAVVTFEDTKTNIEALLKATGGAGYPSKLKQERKWASQLASREAGVVPHNLVIKAPEAGISVEEELGAEIKKIAFTARAVGKYPFYCGNKLLFFASHRERGMERFLEVVP